MDLKPRSEPCRYCGKDSPYTTCQECRDDLLRISEEKCEALGRYLLEEDDDGRDQEAIS